MLEEIYTKKMRGAVCMAIAVLVIVVVVLFFKNVGSKGVDENLLRLDQDWSITFRDTNFVVPSVTNFKVFKDLRRGDSIVYTKKLDSSVPPSSILRFRTYHSSVRVMLGKKVLYEYGGDLFQQDLMVGNGFHYVHLPSNLKGKKLRITVVVSEKSTNHPCSAFEIIDPTKPFDYFARHSFSLGVGLFLSLLGLLAVFSGILAMTYSRSFLRLMLIGVLAFLLGTWTLCYMKVMQVFSMDYAFNTKMEYVVLYLMPIPIEMLLLSMRRGKIAVWKWYGLVCMFFGNILFFVMSSILHLTNVLHYTECLGFFHIYVFVGFLYLIFSGTLYDRRAGLPEKIFTISIAVFGFFAVLDMIRYNIQQIYAFDALFFSSTWLPLGSLLFIILLIVSFFVYLYDMIMDRTEKEVLKQMAFRDSLTGLYNRAKCEQVFEVLNKGTGDYAIVSVDMNGLKKVNDTFGHAEGDNFICAFAEVFKIAFCGVGTTIRMGGDEFVAIVRAEHMEDLQRALTCMERLEKEYSANLPVEMDASYGYAVHRVADDAKAMDIYRMADAKMYAMKVSCHKLRSL